ncbi:RHS repeat-associated core domain-containing protein, partial [Salmonella enterica subsp. enterica]
GIRITYLWDGDSIAEIREYRHDVLSSVRHLVFSGFELVSQQVSRERQAHPTEPVRWVTRTVHAVSEPTGRPLMFFNSAGKAVKRPAAVTLWGQLVATSTADYEQPYRREDEEADPGLLYAGQWRDTESGLCYNRFRYYEPESGMYLVSDPLGLQGGANTYAYVPNPCGYIDPLGLAFCPRMQKALQKLTDQAVADIIANPQLAKKLMSAGSYAHLENGGKLYAASFGKAVERRVAQLVESRPTLRKLVEHTGQSRGADGRFASSPDFTTTSRGVFDVTTRKALQAHIDRYATGGIHAADDVGYLLYDVVYGLTF